MTNDPADAKPTTAGKAGAAAKTSAAPKSRTAPKPDAVSKADAAPKSSTAPKSDAAPKPYAAPPKPGSGTGGTVAAVVRWLLLLGIGGLGVVIGAVGSFAHRATATLLGVAWPTGLFFAFCGLIGLLLGLGELLGVGPPRSWRPTRLSAVTLASAGWLLALLWLTYLGPPPTGARKGDVILANDWRSLAFLFGGMVLATIAVYRAWVANLTARLAAHSKG